MHLALFEKQINIFCIDK